MGQGLLYLFIILFGAMPVWIIFVSGQDGK